MLIEGKKMVCTDLSGCTWLRKSVGANINRNCLFQPLSSSLYLPMMYIVLPYFWLFVCWAIWLENRVFLGLIGCKNSSTCTQKNVLMVTPSCAIEWPRLWRITDLSLVGNKEGQRTMKTAMIIFLASLSF